LDVGDFALVLAKEISMLLCSSTHVRGIGLATLALTLVTLTTGRAASLLEFQDYLDSVVASGVPGIVLHVSWDDEQ
jgi:hypothetical protein